jgi:hypothetical protein
MIITTKVDVVPGSCARHRDVATDSKALWTRVREASRARAPESPSPGEGRKPERPGPTKNTGKGRLGIIRS